MPCNDETKARCHANSQTKSIDPTVSEPNGQEYSVLFSESAIWERILSSQNPKPLFTRSFKAPEKEKRRRFLPEPQTEGEGDIRKRYRRIPSWEPGSSDVIDETDDETDALESENDSDISDSDDTNTSDRSDSLEGYRLSTESVFSIRNASSRLTSASYTWPKGGQIQNFEKSENVTLWMLSNIPPRPQFDHTATQENHRASVFETSTERYATQPLGQDGIAEPGSLGNLNVFNQNSFSYLDDNHGEVYVDVGNDVDVDIHNHHEKSTFQAPQSTEEISHVLGTLPVPYNQPDQINEDIESEEEAETNKGIDYSGFIFPMTTVSTPYFQNVARAPGYNADLHKNIRIELFSTQNLCQIIRRRYVRHDVSILQGHDPKYTYDTNKQFKESMPYQYEFVRTEFIPGTQTLDRTTRCASCAYCEKLQFYNLKNCHYLFHMAHIHGISSDGYLYPDGVEAGIYKLTSTKVSTGIYDISAKTATKDRSCVLCPKCFQVCATHTSKTTKKKAPLAKYQRHFKDKHQKRSKKDDFYDESIWYTSGSD